MLQCFMFQDIIHYGGKSFMHELKVARSQALTTREMAQIGLFTALIAAGPILRSIYRCSLSHAFYHAVFICPVSRIFAWSPQRCNLCGDLSGGRPFRYSGVCGRWRSCLSDPSNIRIFTGLCICCLDHRKAVLPSPGSRYCLGSVQCLLGDDGLLCFRNGVFLWDQ